MKISKEKIINIISPLLKKEIYTDIDYDINLEEHGMDSLTLINIIIEIEKEFNCEIPDSKLLIGELNTVNKIYNTLISISANDL